MNKFPPKKPDNSHIVKTNVKHNWSEYQKAIFKNIAKETGHLIIEAYAGSAKTSSIIESFKYIPRGKKILALAFNKRIQEELQQRAASYVNCRTFHSLGISAIKQRFGNNIQIDDFKVKNIISTLVDSKEHEVIDNIAQTVSFCKYSLSDSPSAIENIINNQDIDLCEYNIKDFTSLVIKTLSLDKQDTNKIDFDDMCWFPFVYNLPLGSYDYVYCDERQDANRANLFMAMKACAPNGRQIYCGDEFQDCYKFRLSDSSVIEDLKKNPTTKILTLPISYRCPKKVIELCKKWVPDITCPDTAPEGEIKDISLNEMYDIVKPGSFIISRTNAPIIKICMTLIRRNIKCSIRGKDIGKQLSWVIKKSKKKQIPAFIKWLDNWRDEEISKLQARKINTDNLLDRYECLVNLCDESKTLDEVVQRINDLFNDTDQKNIVQAGSIHSMKGLEADDVYVLKWTCRIWLDDMMQYVEKPNQECNLAYIAVSRSKSKLFIVHKSI